MINTDTLSKTNILRLRDGDNNAYKQIYNTLYPRLFYFVREYIADEETARNILQDTFLSLWEKRTILFEDFNLNAWLYTVTKNKALKHLRHQEYVNQFSSEKKLAFNENMLNAFALERLNTSVIAFHEIEHVIEKTLNNLPPQYREVFIMSRFDSFKNREIADKLTISEKTVEAHITKTLKLLRIALKDYLPFVICLLQLPFDI
jgi:RNA polymerase sigma-70 factor (ECF subfamily)